MFVRSKRSGQYEYLQVVHNERHDGRVQQRVVATLGRLDVLQATGQLDALLVSCARFAEHSAVLSAQRQGRVSAARKVRIGPPLVFQRLWEELGLPKVLGRLLAERKFGFDVERAIFLTVLQRLFAPGSDRAAEVWRERYAIAGAEGLQLHHLYRAMAWLGEPLPEGQQAYATPFAPRCVKDLIEEALFAQTRDLFTSLELVFFDTTSIYFEGEGGETIGQYGHSKDHRGDCKQIVVAVVLDGRGRPICCELWPGNTTDVKTLLPVIDRLKQRFHITSICIVADRGMISAETIVQLQAAHRDTRYILGARLRAVKEIYQQVLSRGHVFCSFLALMLLKELLGRIERRGWEVEWERLRDDLDALEEITIHTAGRSFVVRSATEGLAGKAIQAAGVALGSAVRLLDDGPPLPPAGKSARSAKDIPC